MDVRGFVYGLIDIFPGPLKSPARKVADVVFGVWDDVSNVFRMTVPHWKRWFDTVTGFANNLVDAVAEAAVTVRWIILEWAPQFVKSKVDAALSWVSARLGEVRDFARGVANGVLDWARARINDVLDFATRVRDWTTERLGEIWQTLSTVARRVNDLLTDPSKLATWLAGAMFWALLKVADGLIEPIVDYLWARKQTVILRAMSRIEAILARLL